MTDYFSYNGEDVVPTYMPGISSYGQEGSEGNTGDTGSSVYYTTYDLTDEDELLKCNSKIKDNLVLSDTDNSPLYNKEYMVGDIIIDTLGNIFVIEAGDDGLEVSSTSTEDESNVKEMFKDFTVKVETSFLRNPNYPGYVSNPEPITLDKIRNYGSAGIDQLREKIFGNWLSFRITPNVKSEPYVYTFCLVLPSKEVLSITTSSASARMFVDNRYFIQYADSSIYARIPDDDPYGTGNLMFGSDVRDQIKDETAYSFILDSKYLFKYDSNSIYPKQEYTFEEYYTEQAKYASMLISYLIHRTCSAYVEIKNKYTGKIYRYDLRDTEGDQNFPVALQTEKYIIPCIEPCAWDITEEDDYKEKLPYYQEIVDPVTKEKKIRKSLRNFIVTKSEQVSVEEAIGSAEYEYIQHFYFTDVNGTEYINVKNPETGEDELVHWSETEYNIGADADDDMSVQTPINYWHRFSCIDEYSNVLKLEFGDITKLCLNIDFSKWKNSDKEFPATAVYVGYPNVHLWQEGDSSGNVILPYSTKEDEIDEQGNPVYDGSRGYYYLYKILPPGYSAEGINADAGRSSIIFDLTQYKLNPEHNWIEIGLMMLPDRLQNIDNKAHRTTLTSLDPDFNYYNEDGTPKDLRTVTFDELSNHMNIHNSTDYTNIQKFCLPFAHQMVREPHEGEEDTYKDVFLAGEPEVTLFINNVVKYSSSAAAESSEEEITVELQEESTKIDYSVSGIHFENEYYTESEVEIKTNVEG